jgi:hypothetical protein
VKSSGQAPLAVNAKSESVQLRACVDILDWVRIKAPDQLELEAEARPIDFEVSYVNARETDRDKP